MLCMGLISQEWATGTIETLMTAPVDDTDVVVGKYLGVVGVLLRAAGADAALRRDAAACCTPDWTSGPVFSGYIGHGCWWASLFVAVSLFCSSLTRSQVVAAVSAVAILA